MAKLSKPEFSERQLEAIKRINHRAACYESESNIKNEQTRHDLSLQAAGLHEHFWVVLNRSMNGTGKAEETRTLPAIASNYARLMDRLGVTAAKLAPKEEDL